ncbi:MAG: MerR family transcriptional regulator [Bacilli bacterium]
MYRIGKFSILAKTTIKTLRYYEKEKLLLPSFVDNNGYRYYDTAKLIDLAKIVSLRQIGLSIEEIRDILNGKNLKETLNRRKKVLEEELTEYKYQLSKINYLLEEENMKYEVITKELPECIVYYKEGIIKDYSEASNFILSSAEECLKTNPNIKCIEPDYCYMNYLDGNYKEKDIKVRYCQAVEEMGTPNETIKFMKLDPVLAVCTYHKGEYSSLGKAYGFLMKYIEDNGYEIIDNPRERYIDGIWNKEDVNDWLTEIEVPVRKK